MTANHSTEPFSIERLRDLLRTVEPGVALVSPRVLRRIGVHPKAGAGGRGAFGHRPAVSVSVDQARAVAEPDELGFRQLPPGLDRLILLERPDPGWLAETPGSEVLSRLWRALFHVRIHEAQLNRPLSDGEVRHRIERIGLDAFNEARGVLEEEHRLTESDSDRTALAEFTATFLELQLFDPGLRAATFPGLPDPGEVEAIASEGLDVRSLLADSRPPGASRTVEPPASSSRQAEPLEELEPAEEEPAPPRGRRSERLFARLIEQGEAAARAGNDVRAAIDGTRAAALVGSSSAGQANAVSLQAIDRLARRLRAATDGPVGEPHEWAAALRPLRHPAAVGFRGASARLLYDLQLVAIEFERPAYKVELLEWALSLGRRSAKRPLPNHREVQIVRHLRRAVDRLGRVRVGDDDRRRLSQLLHRVLDRTEEGLRERFHPLITRSLERADFHPGNVPEQVAFHKLVEELLDRVVENGFLTAGDVRDALSRNAMKLPDLSAPELLRGDSYLRADRRLGVALDGIYRRAEAYLRVLQKGSSLAFGTGFGRFLTLWLILPFGVAFVFLVGVPHLIESVLGLARGEIPFLTPKAAAPEHAAKPELHFPSAPSLIGLGLLLLGLIHSAGFRRLVVRLLKGVGSGLRAVLLDAPQALVALPWVRAITSSPAARLAWRWVFRPAIPALVIGLVLNATVRDRGTVVGLTALAYLAALWLAHSRLGRTIEEDVQEWSRRGFDHIRFNLLPGLYQTIMGGFAAALDTLDRFFYAVDEALRFRQGEGRASLVVKAVAGSVWAVFSYAVRTVVNLLVEPQINPIKHFPVVTVAHKLTIPFLPVLLGLLTAPPLRLNELTAGGITAAFQLLLPGVFGFLVWELKENWRLYAANRARTLRPVLVGSHGETVVRLLRPGFHSGTVPRAFAKLRAPHGTTSGFRLSRTTHKLQEKLIHVEHAMANFIERELLQLLRLSRGLGGVPLRVLHTTATPRRLRVEVAHERYAGEPLGIVFQEQNGWLVAGLDEVPSWFDALAAADRRAFGLALAGLYHWAGVELVHEQIEALAAPPGTQARLERRGLHVSVPGPDPESLWFPLRDVTRETTTPTPPEEALSTARQLLFRAHPIDWSTWVDGWEREQAGEGVPLFSSPDVLPRQTSAPAAPVPTPLSSPA